MGAGAGGWLSSELTQLRASAATLACGHCSDTPGEGDERLRRLKPQLHLLADVPSSESLQNGCEVLGRKRASAVTSTAH